MLPVSICFLNRKKNFLRLLWLLSFTVSLSFSCWLNSYLDLRASAQRPPQPSQKPTPTPRESQPKLPRENQRQPRKTIWQAIFSLFQGRKEPSMGSRNGYICLVSPGLLEKENVIWSDRPLFLWWGTLSSLEIRLYSPFNPAVDSEILWTQQLTANSSVANAQSVPYTGESLQPGETYDWELVNPSSSYRLRRSFQVMDLAPRQRIAADLEALTVRLKATGAGDEEIALEHANYFAQRGFWSDALQVIYEVKNPSPELVVNARDLLKYLCEPQVDAQ